MALAEKDQQNGHLRYQADKHFQEFLKSYPQAYQVPLVKEQLARLALLTSPDR